MTIDVKQIDYYTWVLSFSTAAPVSHVFDYVLDFKRHEEWERELLEVKRLGGKSLEKGARYLKTYGKPTKGFLDGLFASKTRVDCKVQEAERPSRIAWKQELRRQSSEAYDRQNFALFLTPQAAGTLVTLKRWAVNETATSAELVLGLSNKMSQVFQQLPPSARQALDGHTTLSREDVTGILLEGMPARGPGPISLDRLRVVLDGAVGRLH